MSSHHCLLQNPPFSSSCYVNTVIQYLYHCRDFYNEISFRDTFEDSNPLKISYCNDFMCPVCELSKLLKSMRDMSSTSCFHFRECLCKANSVLFPFSISLPLYQHHSLDRDGDPLELINFLFQMIHNHDQAHHKNNETQLDSFDCLPYCLIHRQFHCQSLPSEQPTKDIQSSQNQFFLPLQFNKIRTFSAV